jgi:hypothetical protein
LSFEPRKFRVRLKIVPDKVFVIRQLRRYEWMTLQSVDMPRHELERLLLHMGLLVPSVAEVDRMLAGVASVLAGAILRVSHLDSNDSANLLHQWAELWFNSVDSRLELVSCVVLNGVSLERLWMMSPEEWSVHMHAGIHASTLLGMAISEYIQGGLPAYLKAIREQASAVYGHGPASGQSGTMEEYSFQWRKGSEPVIRGGVR